MPFNQNTTQNTVVYQTSEMPFQAVLANDTAAHANNNNTLATQSDFTFAIGKYERIMGELNVWYFAHQDKDFKFKLLAPTGSTLRWIADGVGVDDSDLSEGEEVTATGTTTGLATSAAAGAGYLSVKFVIINAGTQGNFNFQWEPNNQVDDAGDLTYLKAGSYLKYKRF